MTETRWVSVFRVPGFDPVENPANPDPNEMSPRVEQSVDSVFLGKSLSLEKTLGEEPEKAVNHKDGYFRKMRRR